MQNFMTENEKELITLIKQHPNPEKALEIALALTIALLKAETEKGGNQ